MLTRREFLAAFGAAVAGAALAPSLLRIEPSKGAPPPPAAQESPSRWTQVRADAEPGETVVEADDPIFRAGDEVIVPRTGEVVLLTEVEDLDGGGVRLTFCRGQHETKPQKVYANDWLLGLDLAR